MTAARMAFVAVSALAVAFAVGALAARGASTDGAWAPASGDRMRVTDVGASGLDPFSSLSYAWDTVHHRCFLLYTGHQRGGLTYVPDATEASCR